MNKFKIKLGDPTDSGHGKIQEFIFITNKTLNELQEGYENSCKLTGLQFNHNKDFTELEKSLDFEDYLKRKICTEYEESEINNFAKKTLLNLGINKNFLNFKNGNQSFAELILEFIKLSIPNLTYSLEKDEIPEFNYFGKTHYQFGYGLFS